ncbi:hypothetical protein FB45DRAFT_178121 [Roridomyces roridus]|uniref:TPR-like protein n=1 Tax=Roridomyces roridus TaxID=1738132 RepID=A0AAD7CE44_9AGAR|nr:hypothetical protein FB45DRAFT_178121 [Roridomyces roridus]
MWIKRDKIESEIRRLREHVMSCYIKFTAFSTARIEQKVESAAGASMDTTLRIEHRAVVHHAENQGKLRHIEGMMARVLLEERYGQDVMKRTVEIIASDPTRMTLESQYLSVQALHLVDSLRQVFVSGRLEFQTENDSLPPLGYPVFAQATTPSHILHRILGMVLRIHNFATNQGSAICVTDIEHNIEVDLAQSGLRSEAIAWSDFAIQMFRHFIACGESEEQIVPRISSLRHELVVNYQVQMQYELALQTSEQALVDWETSPKFNDIHWQMWGANLMATHARVLNLNKRSAEAVSLAQVAATVSRPLVAQLAASGAPIVRGTPEEYTIFTSSQVLFFLGEILSSLNRHMEAYEVLKNGFQTVLEFSGSIRPPFAEHIDTFIHQICTLAEGGDLTLQMLHDSVLLVRSLAHHYRENFAASFFRLVCAYICLILNPPDSEISMTELRKLLEPRDGLVPPPSFNPRRIRYVVDELHSYGGQFLEDVIRIYYLNLEFPPDGVNELVIYAFTVHFDESLAILRDVVSSLLTNPTLLTSDGAIYWALNDIQDTVIPAVPPKNRLALIEIADSIIAHYRRTRSSIPPLGKDLVSGLVAASSWALWSAGLFDTALARVNEAIERRTSYLRKDDPESTDQLFEIQIRRPFIVYDTGRILDAMQAAQMTAPTGAATKLDVLWLSWLQARIYRRVGQYRKASTLLTTAMANAEKDPKLEGRLDLWFPTAFAELAAIRNHLGQSQKTFQQVEQVIVVGRQRDFEHATERTRYTLIRYLLILADCLARFGRNEDALAAVEEATSFYIENKTDMWRYFFYMPRTLQELGAECFYSLSLRLEATGKLEAALERAEEATKFYREIASLAPVESPSLARSLRHQASILQQLDRRHEGLTACEEAADILRNASKNETPLLSDLEEVLKDLLEYKTERAAAVRTELAEVRSRVEVLEAGRDFLFFDFAGHFLEDDQEAEGDEDYETATEDSGDEYEDVLETI